MLAATVALFYLPVWVLCSPLNFVFKLLCLRKHLADRPRCKDDWLLFGTLAPGFLAVYFCKQRGTKSLSLILSDILGFSSWSCGCPCLEGFLRSDWKQLCFNLLLLLSILSLINKGEGTQIAFPLLTCKALYISWCLNKELCVLPFSSVSGGSMLGREALLFWKLMVTCCSSSKSGL